MIPIPTDEPFEERVRRGIQELRVKIARLRSGDQRVLEETIERVRAQALAEEDPETLASDPELREFLQRAKNALIEALGWRKLGAVLFLGPARFVRERTERVRCHAEAGVACSGTVAPGLANLLAIAAIVGALAAAPVTGNMLAALSPGDSLGTRVLSSSQGRIYPIEPPAVLGSATDASSSRERSSGSDIALSSPPVESNVMRLGVTTSVGKDEPRQIRIDRKRKVDVFGYGFENNNSIWIDCDGGIVREAACDAYEEAPPAVRGYKDSV